MNDENFDTLLNELSSCNFASEENKKDKLPLKSEDTEQYFLDKTKAIIDSSVDTIQDIAPYVAQGQNPKEIEALSKLVSAAAQALDTLNKKTLIDKKADRDEQLEYVRIQGKKEIVSMSERSKQQITNNNIVIASREEILKKLYGETKEVLKLENK